jgi:hypothetical protein
MDELYRDLKALCSDNIVGQVVSGGWFPDTKVALNEIIKEIAKTRLEDGGKL